MMEPIYLDYHATTPLDKKVLEKMIPFFSEIYGNAASIDHVYGFKAKEAVQQSRESIAKLLGCRRDSEIIFTSGATESNNLALIGTFKKYNSKGNHIISSAIEHPSILDTLQYLKTIGAEVTLIPVDEYGMIDVGKLKNSIRDETILVSVMFANNEVGTIQPIKEIGQIVRDKGIIFHSDATQAVGHEKINVYDLNLDLMSFSAHKFYGPKGVGGLFVRSFSPHIKIDPVVYGGGHERGMRSGTLNVPGIVGMSEALKISYQNIDPEKERLSNLAKQIYDKISNEFDDIELNGHPHKKLSHNINITIPGVEAKGLVHLLKDKLSFSTGAACSTTKVRPSHVLKAMGLDDESTYQTIRIGLGRYTSENDQIADVLIDGIKKLKHQTN